MVKESIKDTEVTIKESKVSKELGAEIKALVPEGTTKRRYDSRIIGDVYAKLVQGNTLDGLINGQLNKFGVVGDNVYGKPKDIFLEDVKAQLYEKSLTRFNPETNDDLGGFVVNELIRYRIGDVVNRYKKEAAVSGKSLDVAAGEVGSVQEIADDTVSIEEQIDLADTETRYKTKLIKATKILSKEQYDKAAEIVKEKVKDIDPKNLSYKKISGFVTDIISKAIGVPAGKITDPKKNLSKGETTAGAMFIENNIDYIRKTLPKGAVTEAATEKLIGTATGVPNSVLKLLYDKNPRIKKGAGLSPWTLKKGLTNQDILNAIGRPKRADDKRIQINPRSPEGQVIKGILSIVDKNIANELVRTVESDLTLEQKQDVAAGKSRLMFSKSSEKLLNKHGLDYTPIRTKTDVDNYINNMVKPLIDIFNSEDYKLLNRTVLQFRSKSLGRNKEVADYLRTELAKLKLPSRVTVGRTKPTKAIGSTVDEFQKSVKSGKLQEYNQKNSIVFDKMWNDINEAVSKDRNMAIPIMYFLENSINEATNPHRMGAPIIGYQFNAGKLYYEHAVQSQLAYITLMDNILDSNKDFNTEFQKIKDNYKIIAISKTNNDKLNKAGYAFKMPEGWNNWYDRYFNEKVASIKGGINPETLIDTNTGELFSEMFEVDSFGKKPSKEIKFSKSEKLDKTFNDILEKKSGIPSRKRYGIVEAITKGSSKGKFNFFIPPSAEDFVGLLYPTLAKGEVGDAQMSWYKKNLIDPYAEAMNKISKARVYMMNTYSSLKKQLDVVPKDLAKKIEGTDYTREQALRVYIWNKQKMNIPGISDADISKLTSYIADDANLQIFGDQLINMQMGDGYVKPKEGWPAGTVTTDILEGLNTTKRAKYLKSWQENVDAIFSEENLNKLQAIYGLNYRKALVNMLSRMKSGRNRSFSGDSLTGRFTDWLTGSVGTIMFLNTRSAVLQTISAINFINFKDNNILAAGKAFANQKQYWTDFTELINSDFLKERRGGLRINVNEADIADMAKKGGVKGAISKLLELGFAPTQIADSFAIASGGATFYRNRINTYLKEGSKFEKPQVIFLTGAAGSGKTTVAKNFGKNWAIVNKDVEMEALMKKAGLPSDLNKLTREQGDKWRKIQSKASENALDKIKKLKEQGKNIIIDDTGSSEATLSMLKRELEKSGYESKMLLLGTSLEQSLKRNKDRKQRTLTDVTVKNSFEALMNNKKRYKEIFKDGFIEATGGKISDNLINELTGKMSQKQAEKKAFEDFRETAEESQQSSRPDRISQQQASPLGRVILAFANTPAQYARIIKKAASDLKNNRGDAKENISKIIYYGAAQNLIFNALQQALFAFGFDEDEPEDKEKQKKYVNIANGMLDSLLRGGGIGGSIVSVGKNAIIKIIKELEKDRPKLQNMVLEVSKISPPVSAKLSRLQQAARSYDWNKQEMKEKGLSLDNPAFLAGANVVSALTNIPLDRAIKKANNVVSATSQDLETWERLALLGGWSSWELGIKKEDKKEKKKPKSKIPVSKVKVRR